jgi:hypothetical protein
MPEFNLPPDIGNRALMRVGNSNLMGGQGFATPGKGPALINFCYGKLRRAELQENVWRFATKKTALRPIDTNTLLLAPTLWVAGTTYFVGSVVSDSVGTYWQSKIRNNLGNQPGVVFSAWEPYFGPLTVGLYDSTDSYLSGEVVYTAAGNGTYNVFQSQVSTNDVHPALPNQWSGQTTYFKDNVVQTFPAWSSGTTYAQGQCAQYTDGNIYASLINSNIAIIPPNTLGTDWALMPTLTLQSALTPSAFFTPPAPITTTPIDEWQIETAYSVGEFVIFNAAVYVTIASGTGNFPNAVGSTSWAACTGGTLWQSLTDLNIGNNPANTAAAWSGSTSYSIGNVVAGSDGYNYTSLINSNLNHNPANNAFPSDWTQNGLTAWTSTFIAGGGNSQWLQIGGAAFPTGVGLAGLNINFPLGAGPVSDTGTRNAFRLPSGYLRRAVQDPSAGRSSQLGFPSNSESNDWEFDGDYLVSDSNTLIVLRFVADEQDVSKMSDMFCEGVARRIALEICEPLTQSTAKLTEIRNEYKFFIDKAKTSNFIDTEADEEPLDDWIACRD